MSAALRKLILLFLIACLPLQGLAAGVKALAQQQQPAHEMAMPMDDEMAGMHGCCQHGHDDESSSPAQPANSCGDGTHCPLCSISVTPTAILPLASNANPTLHPAPLQYISRFYPELPQRPPLSRLS